MPAAGDPLRIMFRISSAECIRESWRPTSAGPRSPPVPSAPWQAAHSLSNRFLPEFALWPNTHAAARHDKPKIRREDRMLLREDEGPEMFRHVVGIAIHHAGGLPAHEVPHRVRSQAVDAIQIRPPLGSRLHRMLAH